MQPKSIVAGGNLTGIGGGIGGQTAPIVPINDNSTEEMQYFSRTTKKLTTIQQGTTTSTPSNLVDTVNVVFRAPVVSSSSNQSMRPPPPPPPKIKGHSEEPSSSIPDLGKFFHSIISSFLFFFHSCPFLCIIAEYKKYMNTLKR